MLTLECQCGESYHAEERYISSSILCRKCGQIIEIGHGSLAPAPRSSVSSQKGSRAPLASSPTIARRGASGKRNVVVGGMVVLALIMGLTAGVRLHSYRAQQQQSASQPASAAVASSAGSTNSPSKEKTITAPSTGAPPSGVPPPDPYARAVADLHDKERPKPAEPFTSGIEHLINDSSQSDPQKRVKLPGAASEEIEPANPRSLPTGTAPFGPGRREGHSTLTVENGTETDALVRVIRIKSGEHLIRNFYIAAGSSFTAETVPPGHYVLRVAFGKDWNDTERRFNVRRSFSQTEYFDITEEEDSGGVTFSRMRITLHKVLNGNFKSHPISEEEFWRLP